jgi:hypothetical protein
LEPVATAIGPAGRLTVKKGSNGANGGVMKMEANAETTTEDRCRSWRLAEGKLYFSGRLERKIFFVLTLAMLLAGIGCRVLGG